MKITVAGDHYTVDVMRLIKDLLTAKDIIVDDYGTDDPDKKISLQEIIPAVTKRVQSGEADFGILACGTGVGVEIGANRFKGIRASLCRDAEQAKNARVYDDANVLCLGTWYKDDFEAILEAWLGNQFDGNEKRRQMLEDFDQLF